MGSYSLLQGIFPAQGLNPGLPHGSPILQADSLPAEPPEKPQNTGEGNLSILQGIFPDPGMNWSHLHCRWILYQLSYQGSPPTFFLFWIKFCITLMPSSHRILCRPLLLLLPIPPSIRVFSNVSTFHIRLSKYWSFSFSISPSNEHPGLISFRMDWLDLLAVQGTLKSILQHHSSKASILQRSAFFTV